MRSPDQQLHAGHIPAELYDQGVRAVVVVEMPAPRSYIGPVALIFAATAGVIGTAFAVLALIDLAAKVAVAASAAAASMAIPSGVGFTIVFRRKG